MTSRLVLRLATLLVCLAVAVPATALVVRITVYFAASFDVTGAPGGGLTAEVGSIVVEAPPSMFTVVADPDGGGKLRIVDMGLMVDARLKGYLKQVCKGTDVSIDFELTCSQTNADLTLRAEDDADSGLIDLTFTSGGGLAVDGAATGAQYQAGVTYDAELRLKDALVGPSTWSLMLKGGPGGTIFLQGLLQSSDPLRLEGLQLIRPGGGTPGEFFLDDVRVSSTTFLPVK